jgi:hypothetical protein
MKRTREQHTRQGSCQQGAQQAGSHYPLTPPKKYLQMCQTNWLNPAPLASMLFM